MTRSELIERLSKRFGGKYSETEVRDLSFALLDQVGKAVTSGRRVELRGFGAFSLRRLRSKRGRNPRTREFVPLQERNTIYFRASKRMRESVKDVIPEKQ